jgi:P27 family predicted phage terminase small subunit
MDGAPAPRVTAHAWPKAPAQQCGPAARQPRQAPPQRCRAAPCRQDTPCPPCLGDEARKEWQRLSKELAQLGLLTGLDRNLLAAYCQAHALWVEAVASIGRYGTMVKSPNGYPMQSPYVAVANKQVDIMVRIAAELGMTPSSRTRIRVGDKPPGDPFEAFLQGRG